MRYILASLILIYLVLPAHSQRGKLVQKFIGKKMDNDAAPNTGPEPDYSNLYFWAASPYKHNPSDSVPSSLKNEVKDNRVDVFFIHPTSYQTKNGRAEILEGGVDKREIFNSLKTVAWNADLSDTALNNQTDMRSILNQASVFNAAGRVFAPRYRQANIKAFFAPESGASQKAFGLAYADIKKAFEYYLKNENNGRPIIIASHSQGTLHAIRLLQEFFDGKPLQKQLVCAYIIGYQIKPAAFKNIPLGTSATQTGCFVTWRSYQKGFSSKTLSAEKGQSVCVNPLTWATTTGEAPKDLNTGALFGFNYLWPHAVSAAIEPNTKTLWVTLPESVEEKMKKMQNLHILDYNLFWMNIRANVKQRVDAYFSH